MRRTFYIEGSASTRTTTWCAPSRSQSEAAKGGDSTDAELADSKDALGSQILWGMSMDTSWRKWGQSALSASITHMKRRSSKVKPLSTRSAASRPSGAQSQAKGRRG